MSMTENNAQQADVLEGAHVVPNANGTAPAQWLDTVFGGHRKILVLLPGPPLEMKPIFDHECMPRLREALPQRFIAMRTLKAAMIGESACDARIAPIYKHYPDIETTILANGGDIQLNLICEKPALDIAQARVDELAGRIEEELDDLIYSTQGESLEEIVLLYLGMKGATLAVAESCTGGLVAERITSIPGSSRAFLGGAVVYSDGCRADRTAWCSECGSGKGHGPGHPQEDRRHRRPRRYRDCRTRRRNRGKAGRPRLHRRGLWQGNRGGREKLCRPHHAEYAGARAHPERAGRARYGKAKADVGQGQIK
jgi:hypothetical protein